MPMTYSCPAACGETTGDPTSMLEHARTEHDVTLTIAALEPPTFVTQFEARQGVRPSSVICCRSCARDTHRVDGQWRHCDDGTLACLNPDTLKPYDPKESKTMSAATATKARVRPSKAAHRAWFATLSTDDKAAARESVGMLVENEDVTERQAWDVIYDAAHSTVAARFASVGGSSSRVERIKAAKAEQAAVKAAAAAGAPRPATPNIDALESGEPASAASTTASKPRAVTGTVYHGKGKTKRGLSSIAYDFTKGCTSPESPRMTVTELRAWLAAEGVTEPDTTTWERTLPNGVVIGVTVPKGSSK